MGVRMMTSSGAGALPSATEDSVTGTGGTSPVQRHTSWESGDTVYRTAWSGLSATYSRRLYS